MKTKFLSIVGSVCLIAGTMGFVSAFTGGCNGNLKGISSLVVGMKAEDAIARLKGIKCGFKPTSCPDQLAHALEEIVQAQ